MEHSKTNSNLITNGPFLSLSGVAASKNNSNDSSVIAFLLTLRTAMKENRAISVYLNNGQEIKGSLINDHKLNVPSSLHAIRTDDGIAFFQARSISTVKILDIVTETSSKPIGFIMINENELMGL